MNTKIKLEVGYTRDFLPFGNYKNYTMLVAVANYSDNPVCKANAEFMLSREIGAEDKLSYLRGLGGFMSKICTSDFAAAYNHGNEGTRAALIEGLKANEIEL